MTITDERVLNVIFVLEYRCCVSAALVVNLEWALKDADQLLNRAEVAQKLLAGLDPAKNTTIIHNNVE